jgi:hypothetical protein
MFRTMTAADRDFGYNENGSFIFATVAETGEVLTG